MKIHIWLNVYIWLSIIIFLNEKEVMFILSMCTLFDGTQSDYIYANTQISI